MKTNFLLTSLFFISTLFCPDVILAKFYVVYDLEEQPLQIDCMLCAKELKKHIKKIKNVGNSHDSVYLRLYYNNNTHVDSSAFTREEITYSQINTFVSSQGAIIQS